MSFRGLHPVRRKTDVNNQIDTLQGQESPSPSSDMFEVDQIAEAAMQAPDEIPASSHVERSRSTAGSIRQVGLKNEKADSFSDAKSATTPWRDERISETAGPLDEAQRRFERLKRSLVLAT